MTERDAEPNDRAPVDAAADEPTPAPEEQPVTGVPSRGGCLTHRQGWAGAHLHGAVRPRRRAAGRGRPPGRWC